MAPLPQRILVTGAAGFVGRHLLPQLRQAFPAARLLAAERPGGPACPDADDVLSMDLEQPEGMAALVQEAVPDAVVHLAAQAAVGAAFADPFRTWRINLLGTMALADAVMRHAPQASFLFISSAEVYGLSFRDIDAPLDELAPMQPANPYAASKAACDLALGEMALRGLRCLRMRPSNHTGPGQGDSFVVSAFARQIARIEAGLQEPVMRVGALDRWRDFLDVRDVCASYAMALRAAPELAPGTVFNVASGTARRIGDVLEGLLARSRVSVRVEEDAARLRPTDVMRTLGDSTRLRQALGWAPAISWDETLDAVLADWRARVAAGAA
ncbi:GDP-mannose 4,6-dehydratase [Roseomonas marmotae]|uniref:GDP-mannose 4,6-dehydratase n=1 Tax=Roseomonas marmotae TaxID=2768161 RepID=A0ABS3KDC2_9PROT|nr:GDP-mannose 4,6-dehydratase [Roseomonas marmotae]MBO1074930.1 GDP-mannose 4,6-dehydratase [Roseomonas marmotae]QTI80024.1 GDP-mannose 4,6-dehydratase [Roseomonas marmotae]